MKNAINLPFVILLLAILGCSCPKLDQLTGDKAAPTPSGTPASSNPPGTPAKTPLPSSASSSLTMAKYNQLKINMPKDEVDRILGGPGTEISTSSGGGMTFSVYKWSGENYTSIILSFKNDKIMSKSQVGLK
jgi:hypothetical protein